MIKFSPFIFILCILSITPPTQAQNSLSLMDAIAIGLKNNYGIQMVKKQEEISSLNNTWGQTARYPNLNLQAGNYNSFIHNEYTTPDSYEAAHLHAARIELSSQWTLFNGFSVNITKQKLEELERLSQGNTALTIENMIEDVILSYYQVVLEHEKLKVIDTILLLAKDRYDYTQERKRLGNAASYDVLQAQNDYLEEKNNRLTQQLRVNSATRQLALILGMQNQTPLLKHDSLQVNTHVFSFADLQDQMLSNNTSLNNQYINQSLLQKETLLRQADRYPHIQLGTGIRNSHTFNQNAYESHQNQHSFDYYGNLTLNYQLFNGGKNRRAIEAAKINEQIAQISIEEMKFDLSNKLLELIDYYEISQQVFHISDERKQAAELNLQISQEKFKNGSINSFNFRDVLQIYMNASIYRLEAMYAIIRYETSIFRITGSITPQYTK